VFFYSVRDTVFDSGISADKLKKQSVFGVFLNDSYIQPSPPRGLSLFFLGPPYPNLFLSTYTLNQAQ